MTFVDSKRIGKLCVLVISGLIGLGTTAFGAEYYASPSAGSGGDGSNGNPWSLSSALSGSRGIKAGDTLWLRGGVYRGTFISNLQGTSGAPIVVRQVPGERATLDGGNSNGRSILTVKGSYTWFWGFEIMSSDGARISSQTTSWPTDIPRGEGVTIDQSTPHPGLKFINLAIHDTRQGVSFWKEAQDGELYGSLIYNNGWDAPDRGHGHGIYSQNQTGTKHIRDNIVFRNFSHGMQIYGSSTSYLNNFDVDGDIWFNNGEPSIFGLDRNVLLGGDSVANNIQFTNNNMFTCKLKLGYSAPANNVTFKGNYMPVSFEFDATNVNMSGNTFRANDTEFSSSTYPNNTYVSTFSGLKVTVRPNAYEAGRANIVVNNWNGQSSASVSLSGILSAGDTYEIRDAQNYFGAPIASGTYNGSSVTIPLSSLKDVAFPIGNIRVSVPHTTTFNAFVVLRRGN